MSRDSASWHATPPDRMARDPSALVRRLLQRYASGDYVCSCHPAAALERRSAKRRDRKASGSAKSPQSLRGQGL
jgi:hypothetical protein